MTDSHCSRRDFARRLALGTGSLALAGTSVVADENTPEGESGKDSEKEADAPPAPEAEDYLLASLLLSYPSEHLTDAMLVGIRSQLSRSRRQAERLRSVSLDNSDEPAFVFRAYRKD
ncbi:MAG: hypothetical protein DWQ34_26595 [Planctomycetota bacterium]|nr:MAG: hypothetical protein DWQ29_24835 [Planctomycetota bacterium]REJ86851.1 MAG: hypothetical protein DWQ34_26595 [Planctomycetota bacterium]REK22790.1 MAG: hypothetical protein DWQ41_18500 [Planctomycetota bacterium]REK33790.1 MAG: hypothetical protein DWQ45_14495 [Planctomycetota bacterium]